MKKYTDFLLIEGLLYVSMRYLMRKDIKLQTIKNRVSEFNRRKTDNWRSKKLTVFNISQWWISYDSIPKSSMKMYNIDKKSALLPSAQNLSDLMRDRHLQSLINKLEFATITEKIRLKHHYELPNISLKDQWKYAKTHAVIELILEIDSKSYNKSQIFTAYKIVAADELLKFQPKSLAWFNSKIEKCRNNSIEETLIHRLKGKVSNNCKIDDLTKYKINNLYRHPGNKSIYIITEKLNIWRSENQMDSISKRAVAHYLSNKKQMNFLLKDRKGQSFWNSNFMPYVDRLIKQIGKAWMIDGDVFPFFVASENGSRTIRLTLVIVIDVYSGRIIGYCLGKSENKQTISSALWMAAVHTKVLPDMLIHDNHNAYKTEQMKLFNLKSAEFGMTSFPSRPRSPRGKAQVESAFNRFNKVVYPHFDGFTGEGILSKTKNARPGPEEIERIYKKQKYTLIEAQSLVIKCVNLYNNSPINEGLSPLQKYLTNYSKSVVKRKLNKIKPSQLAYLFYPKAESVISKSEVIIQVKNQKFKFELPIELGIQFKGVKVDVYYPPFSMGYCYLFDRNSSQFIDKCIRKRVINIDPRVHTDSDKRYLKRRANEKREITIRVNKSKKHEENQIQTFSYNPELSLNRINEEKDYVKDAELQALLNYSGLQHEDLENPHESSAETAPKVQVIKPKKQKSIKKL